MSGRRKPEPTLIERANATPDHGWSPPAGWTPHQDSDPIAPDGWLVWGHGTFAGAATIDEALKLWRAAVTAGWR